MTDPGAEELPPARTTATDLPEQFMLRLDGVAVMMPPATDQRTLRLAVQAVHCYPTNGEQTKLTRRVFNALVANAQDLYEQISEEEKDLIKRVKGTPRFTIRMKRFLELLGKEGTNNYEVIYGAVDAIHKWELKWDVMNDSEPGDGLTSKESAHVISQWGRGVGRMAGTLSYFFPHDVMMMLMEPSRYAQIDLHTANGLGSHYAIELYHQCVRYINTDKMLTPTLPLEEWIRLIAGEGKYADRYKDFKRYALLPACEWLEKTESCPFTVEIRELYGPRKRVLALQFKLHLKLQASLDMRMPPTWAPALIDVLRKVYGMSNKDIKQLALTASEAEVNEAMSRDAVMVKRKLAQGKPINDRANYLRGILRHVQAGSAKDTEPQDVDQETPTRDVQDAVAQVKRLREAFEQFRRTRLQAYLDELPNDTVADLREEFAAAKGHETVISSWLKKGWTKPAAGLMATFLAWFKATYPTRVDSMLVAPEENDFNVWLMLRQADPKTAPGSASP